MKYRSLLIIVIMLGLAFSACHDASIGSSMTLPNGITLSASQAERLQALQPEVDRITSKIAGSRNIEALTEPEHKAIIEAEIELLKQAFGNEWKIFYIVKRESTSYDANTMEIIAQEVPHFIDPNKLGVSTSREFQDVTLAGPLVMKCSREFHWLPWQIWNQGMTETGSYTGLFGMWSGLPATTISVAPIVDAAGRTNKSTISNQSSISRDGIIRYMFNPPWSLPCTITYRAVFAGTPGLDSGDVAIPWN